MLLKRQAFAVFSGELDQYHLYLPLIQGKKAHPSPKPPPLTDGPRLETRGAHSMCWQNGPALDERAAGAIVEGLWQIGNFVLEISYYNAVQRRQWHPTPVLLPEKSHGRRNLVGCSPWGLEEWT